MAPRAAHFAGTYSAGETGGVTILRELLDIQPGVTAIIGAGGKTTLVRKLAEELAYCELPASANDATDSRKPFTRDAAQGTAAGNSTRKVAADGRPTPCARIIVATSTKMFVPDWCPVVLGTAPGEVDAKFGGLAVSAEVAASTAQAAGEVGAAAQASSLAAAFSNPVDAHSLHSKTQAAFLRGNVVCVGSIHEPTGKLQACDLPFSFLSRMADYVLVEADGAKCLPLKAHAEHEPVIPDCASRTICVVGADGLGKPISQACHRAEQFARLAGVTQDALATPESVAAVLNAEDLHDAVFINKAESPADWHAAECLASFLQTPVVAGSLRRSEFRCLR